MKTTTATTGAPPAIDIDRMIEIMKSSPQEPIGEWMRSEGFPPEMYRLLLPSKIGKDLLFPPSYVSVSPIVSKPVFMLRGIAELVELDFTDVAAATEPRKSHSKRST